MANGKSSAPPPAPPPPPPAKSKATGERGTFNAFINSHKALMPYAGQIWSAANNAGGITPTELASVLWFESHGDPNAKSKVGALGLAQIFDNAANPVNAAGVPFFRSNRQISAQDKLNPAFAIQYAAWRLSGAVQKYGSLDAAYTKDYNPGYKGPTPSSLLPKGYVGTPNQTVTQSVTKSVQTKQATNTLTDPWVVKTDRGFSYVNSATPPKNAVVYGGQPITRSEFNQIWKQTYADTFFAYTGRQAKPDEIVNILKGSPSVYTLGNQLANEKSFASSPVYKKSAPGLVQYARTILGDNWKPSGGIIRQAIAENWDQATFYAHIKQLPAYQNGPEFKDNLAKNQAVFESVYGTNSNGDPAVQSLIKQKTQDGWTQDELKSWLVAQPAYKHTAAYQSKTLGFLSQLGLITGAVPTLSGQQVDQALAAGDSLSPGQKTSSPTSSTAANPKAPTPTRGPLAAPVQVSEHGKGGGYR